MPLSFTLPLALAASIVEALTGYPAPLYSAIGHPVTWMGRWLAWLEARLNRSDASFAMRRASGVAALCLYLAPVALVAWAATRALIPLGAPGFAALAFLAASLPAQRSLASHVRAVADGLDASLEEGRRGGRDDRRAQPGGAGRGGGRAGGDREPGREFLRRRGRADPLDRAWRASRRRAL